MNKSYLIFLALLLAFNAGHTQTYSTLIPDQDIEVILSGEIQLILEMYNGKRQTPHKIAKQIVNWTKIYDLDVHQFGHIEDIIGTEFPDTLKGMAELFTESDFNYFRRQIVEQKSSIWHLGGNKIRFVKNCRIGCARYTIPLFNEENNMAIIYEEEVYNPINGCGIIKIFMLEHNKWKLYKGIVVGVV